MRYRVAVTARAPGHTGGVRLFVAVWPPPGVGDSLAALARPRLDGLRPTPPDQVHVTLFFLGEVAEPRVAPLAAALREWAQGAAPVTAVAGLSTRRLGRGVLCVPVSGLDGLALGARRAAAAFAAAPEDHPFTGHLTLARAGRRGRIPDEALGTPAAAQWAVDEVRLVASTLGPSGARYEAVAVARLGGGEGGEDPLRTGVRALQSPGGPETAPANDTALP
jgi:2'-5' RNA ligase